MYNSLKGWLNLPIIRKPFVRYTGSGDKQYGNSVSLMGYISGSVKLVQDREGNEVTSNIQVYIAGHHEIHLQDTVVIEDTDYDIIAINPFYRKGKKDLWVVYL